MSTSTRVTTLSREPALPGGTEAVLIWTENGIDDLYVGDLIRIREMSPILKGVGAHDEPVHVCETAQVGAMVRKVKRLEETLTVGRVYRVAHDSRGVFVHYKIMWSSRTVDWADRRSFKQDVAQDPGRREVRRLRGSGPDRATREALDPVAHSRREQIGAFMRLMSETVREGLVLEPLLLEGNPFCTDDAKRAESAALVDLVLDGEEEAPGWVWTIVVRELNEWRRLKAHARPGTL